MKKLILILVAVLSLSVISYSQKIFEKPKVKLAAGLSILNDDVYTTLEVAKVTEKNSYGFIGETVNPEGSRGRDYFVGVKYLHSAPVSNSTVFNFGGSGLVRLADGHQLTFRPEIGLETVIKDNVSFGATLGFPIRENDNGIFRPVRLQAGGQVIVRL